METPEFEYIGPYRVVRTLGQGGMGTVYHGVNNKTNDPVAIKVISAGMAQHQRFRRRFDAEIQTLLKLKHPGIVQLIGFGEEKGLLFYSMEYVDGENLQQLLRREKRMAWPRVIDMAIEICSALKHAHDFGIIHRDLKPANLMINSQGRVKLTDFGIAKLFGGADSTVEGAVLGTADFMPPEQAEGKPVSVRSDLYSLGSVCYAALTGRAPYQGKTIPEVLFNVRYGSITPIAALAPDTPAELCDLVEELLAREPSLRPPTGLVVGNRFQSLKMGLANRPQSPRVNVDVSHLKELTSIDLNDNPSILPGPENEGTVVATNKTRLVDPSLAQHRNTSSSVAGPDEQTRVVDSQSDRVSKEEGSDGPPSGIEFIGKTKFTEVQDTDRRRSSIAPAPSEETTSWGQWIGIATLSIALLACIAALVVLLQSPSANVLYADVAAAIEANEEEQWLASEASALRFKELYPNDARIADVDTAIAEIESIRAVRSLQRKARRGTADQLPAIEQAYLECLKAQSIDAAMGKQKLQAFLTVFGSGGQVEEKHKRLVELVQRSLEQLNASQKLSTSEAYQSLKEQMDWADANLNPATKRKWLDSMVELFKDKLWARELVDRAKQSQE
jgi:serine/threonine-protein kinase